MSLLPQQVKSNFTGACSLTCLLGCLIAWLLGCCVTWFLTCSLACCLCGCLVVFVFCFLGFRGFLVVWCLVVWLFGLISRLPEIAQATKQPSLTSPSPPLKGRVSCFSTKAPTTTSSCSKQKYGRPQPPLHADLSKVLRLPGTPASSCQK